MTVSLRNISKEYNQGSYQITALREISFDAAQGEYLAIHGPPGAGKTTLFNILGGLDKPSAGTYLLDGRNLFDLDASNLTKVRGLRIGFVFENHGLYDDLDTLDNAALPLLYAGIKKKERRKLVQLALDRVGLSDIIGTDTRKLSGLQRQKVAVARALVRSPSLILADEPTGALDSSGGDELMNLFDGICESGTTVIIFTSQRQIAGRSRRILFLYDGEITGGIRRSI